MINWQELITDPFIQTIGWTLFHSIWEGFLIAVILSFVLSLLWKESANSRYVSSIAAMVMLLLCLTGTFAWQYHEHHHIDPSVAKQAGIEMSIFTEGGDQTVAEESTYFWEIIWTDNVEPFLQSNMPVLVFCWLLGAFLFSIKFIGGYFYLYRLSHYQLKPLPQSWQHKINHLSDQIGLNKAVRVLESALVDEPLTLRHVKPLILVPMGLLSGLSTEQLEAILLHEMAHIRRADYLINIIQSIIEIVLFYHPAVWWISGRIRQTREESCDDLVMQTGRDVMTYAEALTTIQSFYRSPKPMLTMTAIGNKGQFTARIQRLFGQPQKQNSTSKSLLSILVIFACMATLAFQNPNLIPERVEPQVKPQVIEIPIDKSATILEQPIHVRNMNQNTPTTQALSVVKASEEIHIRINAHTSQNELNRLTKKLSGKGIKLDTKTNYNEAGKLIEISGTIHFEGGTYGSFNAVGEDLFVHLDYSEEEGLLIDSGQLGNEWTEEEEEADENSWTEENEIVEEEEPEIEIGAEVVVEGVENVFEEEAEVEEPISESIHESVVKGENVKIKIRNDEADNGQPLFVVDGKVIEGNGKKAIKEISPNDIESINVLKGESAIEAYGEPGANGVVEIFTKNDKRPKSEREKEIELKIKEKKNLERKKKLIEEKLKYQKLHDEKAKEKEEMDMDKMGKYPYYIIDGKPIGNMESDSKITLKDILEKGDFKKEDIESIDVLKGKSAEAIYGSKGKDGVIVITTKNKKKNSSTLHDQSFSESIKVYPNPLEKYLTVQFNLKNSSKVNIQIFDLNGKRIADVTKKFSAGEQRYKQNIDDLAAGTYTISITNGDETIVRKLIKE